MAGLENLEDRVAVVTGGASGIGKGIASQLSRAGCRVVIADVEEQALATAASELGAFGVRCDVSDAESVAALADATIAEFGRVDIVCNNAGIGPRGAIADLTLADWKWMLDVNLWGVVHGIHSFLPLLKANEDGGWIVNTSSMSVLQAPKYYGSYVASKAAVFGMSEVLAAELAFEQSAVGVSILIPGPVRTNIMNSTRNRPEGARGSLFDHDIATTIPTEWRWITPTDAGGVVVDAIRRGELYAVTHPEFGPGVHDRDMRIEAAFGLSPTDVAG